MDASERNNLVTAPEDEEKKDANMQFGHCSFYIEKVGKASSKTSAGPTFPVALTLSGRSGRV